MKIAFVWQGITEHFNRWNDGLREAMRIIEKENEVVYKEPSEDINDVDIILYWEAPCTVNGVNAPNYEKVRNNPLPKILLFAGGPIKKEWVNGFDLLCVESEINEKECEELGINYLRAFGVNDKVFKKIPSISKIYDAGYHATCAGWKRQELLGEALKERAAIVGRRQKEDTKPFDECEKMGCIMFDELSYPEVAKFINKCNTIVNTASYWGGGQRCTLEAMACGVPPVVMSDAPKNVEFVKDSGFGLICNPDPDSIRRAVRYLIYDNKPDPKRGINYIKSKWTPDHYARAILRGINEVL